MSSGDYEHAFCEDLHSRIMEEFHKWREENKKPLKPIIDGLILSTIIASAKLQLYRERPDARTAGFKDLSA